MPTVTICRFNAEWMNDWLRADSDPVAFRSGQLRHAEDDAQVVSGGANREVPRTHRPGTVELAS
jgi:hypothetical protein